MANWNQNPAWVELEQIVAQRVTKETGITDAMFNSLMENTRYLYKNLGQAEVKVGNITTNTLLAGQSASVQVTERLVDGFTYLDFIFNIPRGADGVASDVTLAGNNNFTGKILKNSEEIGYVPLFQTANSANYCKVAEISIPNNTSVRIDGFIASRHSNEAAVANLEINFAFTRSGDIIEEFLKGYSKVTPVAGFGTWFWNWTISTGKICLYFKPSATYRHPKMLQLVSGNYSYGEVVWMTEDAGQIDSALLPQGDDRGSFLYSDYKRLLNITDLASSVSAGDVTHTPNGKAVNDFVLNTDLTITKKFNFSGANAKIQKDGVDISPQYTRITPVAPSTARESCIKLFTFTASTAEGFFPIVALDFSIIGSSYGTIDCSLIAGGTSSTIYFNSINGLRFINKGNWATQDGDIFVHRSENTQVVEVWLKNFMASIKYYVRINSLIAVQRATYTIETASTWVTYADQTWSTMYNCIDSLGLKIDKTSIKQTVMAGDTTGVTSPDAVDKFVRTTDITIVNKHTHTGEIVLSNITKNAGVELSSLGAIKRFARVIIGDGENLCKRLVFPQTGYIYNLDVTITSEQGTANATGKVTKQFYGKQSLNTSTLSTSFKTKYIEVSSSADSSNNNTASIKDVYCISDLIWDSTLSAWTIEIIKYGKTTSEYLSVEVKSNKALSTVDTVINGLVLESSSVPATWNEKGEPIQRITDKLYSGGSGKVIFPKASLSTGSNKCIKIIFPTTGTLSEFIVKIIGGYNTNNNTGALVKEFYGRQNLTSSTRDADSGSRYEFISGISSNSGIAKRFCISDLIWDGNAWTIELIRFGETTYAEIYVELECRTASSSPVMSATLDTTLTDCTVSAIHNPSSYYLTQDNIKQTVMAGDTTGVTSPDAVDKFVKNTDQTILSKYNFTGNLKKNGAEFGNIPLYADSGKREYTQILTVVANNTKSVNIRGVLSVRDAISNNPKATSAFIEISIANNSDITYFAINGYHYDDTSITANIGKFYYIHNSATKTTEVYYLPVNAYWYPELFILSAINNGTTLTYSKIGTGSITEPALMSDGSTPTVSGSLDYSGYKKILTIDDIASVINGTTSKIPTETQVKNYCDALVIPSSNSIMPKYADRCYIVYNAVGGAGNDVIHMRSGVDMNYSINTGDGRTLTFTNDIGGDKALDYATGGLYLITVLGNSNGFRTSDSGQNPYADNNKIIELYLGTNFNGGVTTSCYFNGCPNLEKVEIFEGFLTIGNHTFRECPKLKTVIFPSEMNMVDTQAFYNCNALKDFKLPKLNAQIALCYIPPNVTDFVIPNGITNIPAYVFQNCVNIRSIVIPSTVTQIGNYAFKNCEKLTDVTILGLLTSIGIEAFSVCSSLHHLTLPYNAALSVESNAFFGVSLSDLEIEGGVDTATANAFKTTLGVTIKSNNGRLIY